MPCVGLCQASSRDEHLIQAADFLAGAVKLAIDFGLGNRDYNQKIMLAPELSDRYGLSGDRGIELGWFMFVHLRYCIWGDVTAPAEHPHQPWKTTSGRGLTSSSTVPEATMLKAAAHLDGLFMGCVH